jgi:hypothetical protein
LTVCSRNLRAISDVPAGARVYEPRPGHPPFNQQPGRPTLVRRGRAAGRTSE